MPEDVRANDQVRIQLHVCVREGFTAVMSLNLLHLL